jgi:hypothetical protein
LEVSHGTKTQKKHQQDVNNNKMSKRKTVSQDEKLDALESWLIEQSAPYSISELEKQVPKHVPQVKNSMLIKDLMKALTGDQRVETDKIGASNYYWAFPSQAAATRKRKIEVLETEITGLRSKKAKLEEDIQKESENKEDSDSRQEQLDKYQQLLEKKSELDKKLSEFAERDPAVVQKIVSDTQVAFASAERWTDNIYELKKYCQKNFNMDNKTFFTMAGVEGELEDVDSL